MAIPTRKTTVDAGGESISINGVAGGAIKPGHQVMLGSASTWAVVGTADVKRASVFAKENEIFGKGVDDAYASGDAVLLIHKEPGTLVNVRVAAAAAAIAVGDMVTSAGDGTVKKTTSVPTAVGYAEEACDNSGGSEDAWLRIRLV